MAQTLRSPKQFSHVSQNFPPGGIFSGRRKPRSVHLHDVPTPYNPSGDASQILLLLQSPGQESPKMSVSCWCRTLFPYLHKSRAFHTKVYVIWTTAAPCDFFPQVTVMGYLHAQAASPAPVLKAHRPMGSSMEWTFSHHDSSHLQPPMSDSSHLLFFILILIATQAAPSTGHFFASRHKSFLEFKKAY